MEEEVVKNDLDQTLTDIFNKLEPSEKLTDWSNEPTINELRKDIDNARTTRSSALARIKRWNNLAYVSGFARPKKTVSRTSTVQPPLIRKYYEWRIPSLTQPFLENDKIFQITPNTYDDMKAAQQQEQILNYQFNTQMDRVFLMDNIIRTLVFDGTVILKPYWDRKTYKQEVKVDEYEYTQLDAIPENLPFFNLLKNGIALKNQDEDSFNNLDEGLQESINQSELNNSFIMAAKKSKTIEIEKVLHNRPNIDIIDAANFWVDPTCKGDFSKATFCAQSFLSCKADLEQSGLYKNLDKVSWDDALDTYDITSYGDDNLDNLTNLTTTINQGSNFNDKARKKVQVVEYWGYYDIEGDNKELTCIVATWIGNTLIRLEKSPYPDNKLPFIVIPYTPIRYEIYGEPDAELIADNQNIVGAMIRSIIEVIGKSAAGQVGVPQGFLNPTEKINLDEGRNYTYNPNGMDPRQAIVVNDIPELSSTPFNIINMQKQDADALIGMTDLQQGMDSGGIAKVSRKTPNVTNPLLKRETSILQRISNGMKKLAEKIIMLNILFLSDEDVVKINKQEFVQVDPNYLDGSFSIDVDVSTLEKDQQKIQSLQFILQTAGDSYGPEFKNQVWARICKLQGDKDLADMMMNYQPPPDPLQDAQLQLIQAQVQYEQMKIQALQSTIPVNQTKAQKQSIEAQMLPGDKFSSTQLNIAKEQFLQAQTSNTNYKTLDDQTGKTQDNDIAKISSQAQANADRDIIKALSDGKPKNFNDILKAANYNNAIKNMNQSPEDSDSINSIQSNPTPLSFNGVDRDPSAISYGLGKGNPDNALPF